MAIVQTTDQTNINDKITTLNTQVSQADKDLTKFNTVELPALNSQNQTNITYYYKQDAIINQYANEINAMVGGPYVTDPVTEADLTNISGGRLWPPNAIEMVRIPEFDGGGITATYPDNEQYRLQNYMPYENYLTQGLQTSTAITSTSLTAISSGSSTIDFHINMTILAGNQFLMYDAGTNQSFIGSCTSVTDNASSSSQTSGTLTVGVHYQITNYQTGDDFTNVGGANVSGSSFVATDTTPTVWTNGSAVAGNVPATKWVVHFSFVTPITGTLPVGSHLNGQWTGFTNSERAAKHATLPYLQEIMDYEIKSLQNHINGQIGFETTQKNAIVSNQDPGMATTALPNINQVITSYQNYLKTTDISDAGFTGLNNQNSARLSQISARVGVINGALPAFYDKRYYWAKQRSGSGGTYIQIIRTQNAITATQATKNDALAQLAQMGPQGNLVK
jgi:hypothetical protein